MLHFTKKPLVSNKSLLFMYPMQSLTRFTAIVRDPFVYLFPAYNRIPSKYIPYRNRARKANEDLRTILTSVINERREAIKNKTFVDNQDKPDLLSLMIMAAEEGHGGSYLTDGELISNLAVFFVAGKMTSYFCKDSYL
jgi:cytochrome P450